MAFAWSGLSVACLCYLKRSRIVRLVSPIYCFLHLLHWIMYVRFVDSQVMSCLICLVSPVLLKVSKVNDVFPWLMYGQVRKPCLELQGLTSSTCITLVFCFTLFLAPHEHTFK